MSSDQGMRRLFYFIAVLCLVILLLGAFVRGSGAGLACPDWPLCFGALLPDSHTFQTIAGVYQEYIHRVLAGILALLIAAAALKSRGLPAERGWVSRAALGLLILVIIQAVFGGLTVLLGLQPAVVTTHLVLGTLVFQISALLASALAGDARSRVEAQPPILRRALEVLAFVTFLQVAVGGYVASNNAGYVCQHFPVCDWRATFGVDGARLLTLSAHFCLALLVLFFILSLLKVTNSTAVKKDLMFLTQFTAVQIILGFSLIHLKVPVLLSVLHLLIAQLVLLRLSQMVFLYSYESAAVQNTEAA